MKKKKRNHIWSGVYVFEIAAGISWWMLICPLCFFFGFQVNQRTSIGNVRWETVKSFTLKCAFLLYQICESANLSINKACLFRTTTTTHTFGIGVLFELLLQSLQWERTQLLHPNECRVLVGCWCLPLFQQGIVMLPWAQHHLLDTARNKNNDGLG